MKRNEQISLIREKCIAANPEIQQSVKIGENDPRSIPLPCRTIRLADVLLAIGVKDGLHVTGDGTFYFRNTGDTGYQWNLRQDDLTEQSDECILFLSELLK